MDFHLEYDGAYRGSYGDDRIRLLVRQAYDITLPDGGILRLSRLPAENKKRYYWH